MFEKIVYGPIKSRRLGLSLGVNLLPHNSKLCSFDCIYCECGFNKKIDTPVSFPTVSEVDIAIENALIVLKKENTFPDVITFAGNGEPTLHPDFNKIIDNTISLRNKYAPKAKIAVLTNGVHVSKMSVFNALEKVDCNILKLDAGIDATARLIDRPASYTYSVEKQIELYKKFDGNFILQTMFLTGEFNGKKIDNTSENEIKAWLEVVQKLKPCSVMLYTIDRITPAKNICKVSFQKLKEIAESVNRLGIDTIVAE